MVVTVNFSRTFFKKIVRGIIPVSTRQRQAQGHPRHSRIYSEKCLLGRYSQCLLASHIMPVVFAAGSQQSCPEPERHSHFKKVPGSQHVSLGRARTHERTHPQNERKLSVTLFVFCATHPDTFFPIIFFSLHISKSVLGKHLFSLLQEQSTVLVYI